MVWVNFNIPAQNKVNKTNPPEPVINNTIPDNRIVTKIIYENMNTSTVNQAKEGRIGDYFIVKLVDNEGNALAGLPIKIGLNGKVYDKNTTSNGVAKLQINLIRKIYTHLLYVSLGMMIIKGHLQLLKSQWITIIQNLIRQMKTLQEMM